jgi:hypothetical protein
MAGVLVASESFSAELNGEVFTIHKGITRVSDDHPLAKTYPDFFKAQDVHFGTVEVATQAPGEKRAQTRKAK